MIYTRTQMIYTRTLWLACERWLALSLVRTRKYTPLYVYHTRLSVLHTSLCLPHATLDTSVFTTHLFVFTTRDFLARTWIAADSSSFTLRGTAPLMGEGKGGGES